MKTIKACLSLAALVVFLPSATPWAQRSSLAAPTWRELGPAPLVDFNSYSGRISAIACSPTQPGLYYAGGADSGVWRTTDAGRSWEALTDHLPSTAIGALAIDPNDESVLYAGTGEANYANHSRYGLGLYKSIDGGDTWTHLGQATFSGRAFSRVRVDPQNSQRVFASITRAGGFPELAAAKGHPQARGDLGMFRSEDAGVTWTRLSLPNRSVTDFAFKPGDSSVLYAGVGRIFGSTDNGLYRSLDGGDTWARLTAGLPPIAETGRISLDTTPANPDRIYVMITRPANAAGGGASTRGGYRSDNGGASFTQIPIGSIQSSYGWYLSVVRAHPTNADRVYMGGLQFFGSNNAGTSFFNATPPHVDMHAADWDAAGRLVVGDDGGVHRSSNGGSTWIHRNKGLGSAQFYAGLSTHPRDPQVIAGGLQDNGSVQRESKGTQWTQVFGGDGGWTQIDQADPDRRFVEYQGTGNLFVTSNAGQSFNWAGSGLSGRNAFLPPFLIDPRDSNRMLYGTERVYQSLNAGSSWSALSGDVTTGTGAIRSMAMSPADPDVVWVATNDGLIQVSEDGGATFQLSSSGNPGWPRVTREITPHPGDPMVAYQAVSFFGVEQVRKTTDRGLTWKAIDQGLPDVPVNVVGVVPGAQGFPDTILAGTDSGLYHTTNEGKTWKLYGLGLPRAPVIDMLVQPDRGRILVATQGRGAWTAQLRPRQQ